MSAQRRASHYEAVKCLRCSPSLRRRLAACVCRLSQAVGDGLVGIYLYGSLARECHNPKTSDVDLLMVTEEPCSDEAVAAVTEAHAAAGIPVDLLSMTQVQIALDAPPTPVDFTVNAAGLVRSADGKADLPLIRQDAYECDTTLAGAAAREAITPVPWPALAQSLEFLFPHIVPQFKNPVLMLCRVLYAYTTRALCSKQTAGEWALDSLDPMWQPAIQASLNKYRAGVADNQGPNEELRAFEQYCSQYITSLSRCSS